MLLREIDKELDMECKIVFNKDDRIFSLSKALNRTFQAFVETKNGERVLSVYVPKGAVEEAGNMAKFLTSGSENERFLISDIPIEDSIFEFLIALGKIESTSTFDVFIQKGKMTVRFRFHKSAIPNISQVLAKNDILKHLVKEISILPTAGFITYLDIKNKEFSLHLIEYSMPFSIIKNEQIKSLFKNGAIAEVVNVFSDTSNHKLLIYGAKGSKTDLKPISPGSDIYEVPLETLEVESFNVLTNVFNSKGIKRYNIFYKKVDDTFRILTFLERYDAMKHISELFIFYNRLNQTVDLSLSMGYTPEMLESL